MTCVLRILVAILCKLVDVAFDNTDDGVSVCQLGWKSKPASHRVDPVPNPMGRLGRQVWDYLLKGTRVPASIDFPNEPCAFEPWDLLSLTRGVQTILLQAIQSRTEPIPRKTRGSHIDVRFLQVTWIRMSSLSPTPRFHMASGTRQYAVVEITTV